MSALRSIRGNILLLFPPTNYQVKGGVVGRGIRKSRALAPALGLLYLAAELLEAGYNVDVVDLNAQPELLVHLEALINDKDVVGITTQSWNREAVASLIARMKRANPQIPIMAGGPDCILHRQMLPLVDVVATGEAENTIVRIVDALINRRDLSDCPGVIFRHPVTGEAQQGKPDVVQMNLDLIKFPARQLVKPEGYTMLGKRLAGKVALIITSRGCPYSCRFCARGAVAYNLYRERSVQNVLEELEQLHNQGYKVLCVVDDVFLMNKKRVHQIMDGIIENGLQMPMLVQGRVESTDEALFMKLRKAGVRVIVFGIESANQDVLDFYNKRSCVEKNWRAVSLAHQCGLFTFGFFILGAPMETKEHLQRTIEFAYKLPLDGATFNILDYTYGSELWDIAHSAGLIDASEFNIAADSARGLALFPREELEQICIEAFDGFYQRPSLWWRVAKKLIKNRDFASLNLLTRATFRLVRDFMG